MKLLKKGQLPIFLTNTLVMLAFIVTFFVNRNFEFLLYVGILFVFMTLILSTNKKVNYSNGLLWALSVWAFAHMAGGGVYINGVKLYETMLIPLIGEPYNVLKYDQLVHAYGFGVTTFLVWHLLKSSLKMDEKKRWVSLSIVCVMAATGFGALNEVIEFSATVIDPGNGVGGYINNAIDLVSNLIGAIIAMVIIVKMEKRKSITNK
ncbi:MAG: DUF2238 domain-containing protein [Patescibacteria group bacterium]|nr:DUF2238 domain-containing protein [Patescibacteria group bacterium]